jgi:hypothetical protein
MKAILFRGSLLLAALTFIAVSMSAQPRHRQHPPRPFHAIEQHKAELEITESQQAQLDELKASFQEEAKALREQDLEHDAKREAMHSLMDGLKTDLEDILTEAQTTQLKSLMKAKHKEHKARMKEAHDDLKVYKDENIKPVMLAQRQKLEAKISAEDRAEIAQLREVVAKRKAERKAAWEAAKAKGERPDRPAREEHPEREAIKQLVDKYDTEIEALFAEIEPQAKQWKEDMQFIMQAHRPEGSEFQGSKSQGDKFQGSKFQDSKSQGSKFQGDKFQGSKSQGSKSQGSKSQGDKFQGSKSQGSKFRSGNPHGHKGKGHKAKGGGHPEGGIFHKARFLLMDPAEEATASTAGMLVQETKAYPNPANEVLTLDYELVKSAQVDIQIHSKEGQLQQTLPQGQLKAGSQSVRLDVSSLRDGAYYLSVIADGQLKMVPFVVTRQ